MTVRLLAVLIILVPPAVAARAQATPVSRSTAVQTALDRGARLGVARADTALAFAQMLSARAYPNPTLAVEYSKSAPQYHVAAGIPLDYLWLRHDRVRSAEAGRTAAQYRYLLSRATIALDVDTTYTRTVAAMELLQLSRRTAQDADSLRRMVATRRDAGDASDLDVELATVNAGQQENVAAADSLTVVSTLLDLQAVMGLAGDRVLVLPTDSLVAPPEAGAAATGEPLPVAAAAAALDAAQRALRVQRRSVWNSVGIALGFETHDPSGSENGILPTIGVALPLPFVDRNRGAIAQADAERARATAELDLARIDAQTLITRATRERANALGRVARDRTLIASANRVATMSLTAYREGASTLPNVLEAQRQAREVLAQYIQDLAAAWIATAALRAYSLTSSSGTP